MPDEQGSHSRKEMEAILASGQGIVYRGQVITKASDLPTDVDLARGDSVREAEVAANLQRQMADLQAQMADLQAGRSTAAGTQKFQVPTFAPESTDVEAERLRQEEQRKAEAEREAELQRQQQAEREAEASRQAKAPHRGK